MNNTIRKEFGFAGIITVVAVALAMWYGFRTGGWERALNDMLIVLVLGVMEISLSFDNAVINASVLKNMSAKWQQRFLVWGILIAVVGMRLIFPIAIVALSAGLGFFEVGNLALNNPEQYALELEKSSVTISAFGGVFLLMVALNYFIDTEKDEHWLMPESRLAGLARVEAVQIIIAMVALMGITFLLVPVEQRLTALSAGIVGLLIYLAVNALGRPLRRGQYGGQSGRGGLRLVSLPGSAGRQLLAGRRDRGVCHHQRNRDYLGRPGDWRGLRAFDHPVPGSPGHAGAVPLPGARRPLRHPGALTHHVVFHERGTRA